MYDEMLRHNLIMREWLNGSLLPLNLSLIFVIGLFLWDTYQENHRGWSVVAGVPVACALWWIFAADAVRAGTVWMILRLSNRIPAIAVLDPSTGTAMAWANVALIMAGIAGVMASLRCAYLFTPKAWGHWYWIGTALVTLSFLGITRTF